MKKLFVVIGLGIFVFALSSFVGHWQTKDNDFKAQNLKILPQDISKDSLMTVMHQYNKALGVSCSFCHAQKDGFEGLDFASDDKEHKVIARRMMVMMDSINNQFFSRNVHHNVLKGTKCRTCHEEKNIVFQVTCNTCHNGKAMPATFEGKMKP